MRAEGGVVRRLEVPGLSQVWETMMEWLRSTLTPERKAEAILTAGTLVLIGYFAFVSFQALQDCTITGFGETLSIGLKHVVPIHLFAS